MPAPSAREIVYDMLMRLGREGDMSHKLLRTTLESHSFLEKRDRAFISRLFRGVLERRIYLDYVIAGFSSLRPEKLKPGIKIILEMGTFQILFMDSVPDQASCNESVKLAKKKGYKALSGYVNGVLRNLAREKERIVLPDKSKDTSKYISVKYSLPHWLVNMWLEDYGIPVTEMMGEAFLRENDLCVRFRDIGEDENSDGFSERLEELINELSGSGINVRRGELFEDALWLDGFDKLDDIPVFRDGRLTVQDESTMLAARIAGVKASDKVIDVCAAPGGKSIQLADYMRNEYRKMGLYDETVSEGRVFARDISETKAALIEENIKRTGLSNITVQVQDALKLREEDIGTADIVIADLPCSGLGVIGRKPDIKYNTNPESIDELAELQRKMLELVSSYVKKGGALIYSTCSVSKKENEDNMRWFEENHPFRLQSIDEYLPQKIRDACTAKGWLQILPGQYASDGFFAARFVRE